MQKANLSWLFLLNVCLLIILFISLSKPDSVRSALAGHIVISEIQISGTTTGDEFVELFNPTDTDMDLTGWRLARKTSGTSSANLLTNMSGSIPAHGYFLVTPPTGYTGSSSADLTYSPASTRISANNTVYLFASDSATLVDKVGIGDGATDGEGSPAPLPADNQSIERKAHSSSTQDSMASGADMTEGNGEDTDDNSSDFILRSFSNPQDSTSSAEIPSASASAGPSSEPSDEPSASPSASPSPSIEPSPSASASASPSASPSLSPSPSASTSPSATPQPSGRPRLRVSCTFEPQTFQFGNREFTFKVLSCKLIRV